MLRLNIKNLSEEITNGPVCFETIEALNEWKESHIEMGTFLFEDKKEFQDVLVSGGSEGMPEIFESRHVVVKARTHTFEITDTELDPKPQEEINQEAREFLGQSDWKVTRHRDQKDAHLGTSLTEEEFQDLLTARQEARDQII